MKIRKKPGGVLRQLMVSYAAFAFLLAVGVYIGMFAILIVIGNGSLNTLAPYELVDKDGTIKDISALEKNGGWIEKMDDKNHVLAVYGNKQDTAESYKQEELYEYLITDNVTESQTSAKKYRGFIQTVKKGGTKFYYFIKIPRAVMSLTYNYNVGSSNGGTKLALTVSGLFILFFLVNCFFMSRYLLKKIKRPLYKITAGMQQVISTGVDQVHLDFQVQREFEEIRDSFNIMTERLEAEKRAKRINEEKKNRMLLELSHDIKTPVSTIRSYANALEEGLVKQEDLHNFYHMIDKKACRVDALVNDMFLMLKLDNPQYEPVLEKTDICELVRAICAEYYDKFETQQIKMYIGIPEEMLEALIDRKEFIRVIENLLENIIKYNQTGNGAWISVTEDNGKILLMLCDDGEAIAEDIRSILFDPFVRGDKARMSKGGTGLGLAIAKKIVDKMEVEIEYQYRECKNCFIVRI